MLFLISFSLSPTFTLTPKTHVKGNPSKAKQSVQSVKISGDSPLAPAFFPSTFPLFLQKCNPRPNLRWLWDQLGRSDRFFFFFLPKLCRKLSNFDAFNIIWYAFSHGCKLGLTFGGTALWTRFTCILDNPSVYLSVPFLFPGCMAL